MLIKQSKRWCNPDFWLRLYTRCTPASDMVCSVIHLNFRNAMLFSTYMMTLQMISLIACLLLANPSFLCECQLLSNEDCLFYVTSYFLQ